MALTLRLIAVVAVLAGVAALVASRGGAAPASYGLEKEIVRVLSANDSQDHKWVEARCPRGKVAVGGGYDYFGMTGDALVTSDRPLLAYEGWAVGATEPIAHGNDWQLAVFAVCVNPYP